MRGKELTHLRINIICVYREAAFGKKTRVDPRSRTEVEQRMGARRDSQPSERDPENAERARAAIRFQRRDLLDVFRTGD